MVARVVAAFQVEVASLLFFGFRRFAEGVELQRSSLLYSCGAACHARVVWQRLLLGDFAALGFLD